MKKSTLDHLITFAMVIVAYLIVQILIAAGVLSSLSVRHFYGAYCVALFPLLRSD